MITLPEQIAKSSGWDGTSANRYTISPVQNLESEMDFAEHQRIVFEARTLLAGQIDLGDKADTAAGRALLLLKEAYESTDVDYVLKISKGIHRPYADPHIQLSLKDDGRKYLYHLDVSIPDGSIEGLPDRFFTWKGVRFSAKIDEICAWWPLAAVVNKKSYQRRRLSIAPEAVQGQIEKLAELERQRLAAEQAEALRRKADSDRSKAQNALEAKLKAQSFTLAGNKAAGLKTLLDGGTVPVTTKTRKTIQVRLQNGNIVNAGA